MRRTLDRLAPAERTVGSELVVARFIERFAAGNSGAETTAWLAWVDAAATRYTGILPVPLLFTAAFDTLVEAGVHLGASATMLRSELERRLARPRLVRAAPVYEAIDEVDVALDDLLTRLDQNDPLTAEHSRAVSAWCARLAGRLALSPSDTVHVARCGLVHDAGKIAVPAEVLNAPRALDAAEWVTMRAHADHGARIVAETPLLRHLAPAARSHHERLDGRGYPQGLRGSAIPHVARIVAVADAFNAMIGRRPYRPPLAPASALDRIVAARDSHFDPIVVDAMIDVVTNRTSETTRA